MGKGDKRTKKGKIWRASYGKSRPRNKNKVTAASKATATKPAQAPATN